MSEKTCNCNCAENRREQFKELQPVLDQYAKVPGSLITILQKAQEIYGYLPREVQIMIAEGMDVPLEKVYGVATFYAQFALSPKGEYDISVCLGTACYVKGSQQVLDKICEVLGVEPGECSQDGRFSVSECRCIGACGLAPVFTINGEVYGKVKADDVPGILAKYMN